jgi:hypothetical protein
METRQSFVGRFLFASLLAGTIACLTPLAARGQGAKQGMGSPWIDILWGSSSLFRADSPMKEVV